MKQICRVSQNEFEISDKDIALLEKISPRIGDKTHFLPPPTLCPLERKRNRLAFRNERKLYHRKCDLTGKAIISVFSPDKTYKVYSKTAWWSDRWDARSYGRDFDFSRSFFEQFAELKKEVPQVALVTSPDADENNCPYINFAGNSRNCHMTFDSDFNEDSYYSNVLKHSRNCLDCSYVHSSELCYECIDCDNCYELRYSQDCSNCNSSYFLFGCIGCANCCLCTNLVRKEYHILNQAYSKKEYFEKIQELRLNSFSSLEDLQHKFNRFHLKHPKKFSRILKTENCLGDYIRNAKNCYYCFNVSDSEDLRYCDSLYSAKDCMDVSSFGENIECTYHSGTIGINCFNISMSYVAVLNCDNLIYCDNCRQSSHNFGCCSLRRNSYCILNKQYTKEEYESLSSRIIEHMRHTKEWGEYFPISLSPFGYNESVAAEHLPLPREDAEELGAKWSEYEAEPPLVKVISTSEIPDTIEEANESILAQAISCEETRRAFRVIKKELDFYKKHNIPLPRLHPEQRHQQRVQKRNPQKLWTRKCHKSGDTIATSYSPERPEIVYSERAYAEALE